jgi:hypothetical protein
MSLLIDLTKTVQGKPIRKASETTRNLRLAKCKTCPHLVKATGSCGTLFKGGRVEHEGQEMELCGCIVSDKTKYADDGCPLGKW